MIYDLLKSALNQDFTALNQTERNQKRYLPSNFKTVCVYRNYTHS
jgi:hypothetical protein